MKGLGGAVLDVVTGNLENAIVQGVGTAFWNLITKGTATPQTSAEWDKQALTQGLTKECHKLKAKLLQKMLN